MSSDTRQRIALAAMQLFWEKGYGSTSIADVLKAAGVNSGSLYHFFPGKQELLLAVLEMYRGGIGPMLLEPAWRGVEDPIERVFALLGRYRASLLATDCSFGCPIGSVALELHEPDPPVRALLAANFDAWSAAIDTCIGQAGARLPAGIDCAALAQFVLATMEGAVMQARTYRDIKYFDGPIAQLRAYLELLEQSAAQPARKRAKSRSTR
jgi:TetR/AcrR family transcriptional regulator, transcriptional repressor for nem operon